MKRVFSVFSIMLLMITVIGFPTEAAAETVDDIISKTVPPAAASAGLFFDVYQR